jgi:ribose transport system permease protein
MLTRTIFGRRVFAVGTNQAAAYVSGVRVKSIIFTLSAMSGLYAGIAAILYTAKNEAGIPTLGDRLFIDVVSSIIIGGTSVNGGKGGVVKTLFGVLFIVVMDNVLVLKGITWYVITLIKGLLVLVLVLVTSATIPVPKLLRKRTLASNTLSD